MNIELRQYILLILLSGSFCCGLPCQADAPIIVPTPPVVIPANLLGAAEFLPTPQHPVGYRGDGSGRYPGATHACLQWAEHGALPGADRNILWKTELLGFTQSHPIIVGDNLITLEEPSFVVCLDANSGKLRWRTACDHLALFAATEQQQAHTLMRQVEDSLFKARELADEYSWLTGRWNYAIPGARARKGNIDNTPTTTDRIAAIRKEWIDRGFAGSPEDVLYSGHGLQPYAAGSAKYTELATTLADLQVDYGIVPQLNCFPTQAWRMGQTQGTPTSDGSNIFVTFGYGQTACLDLDGHIVWMKWFAHILDKSKVLTAIERDPNVGYQRNGLTGPSPLLVGDTLIVTQGYAIRALDKATGNQRWMVKYGNGNEANAGRAAYRGPALMTLPNGDKVLICPQGYVIRVADGKVLTGDAPQEMFMLPIGNVHCYMMGLVTNGDTCYYTWALGAGAFKVVNLNRDLVECRYLWRTMIPAQDYTNLHPDGIPFGNIDAETYIENAPVYDPDRKRIYISTNQTGCLWSIDAVNGRLLEGSK